MMRKVRVLIGLLLAVVLACVAVVSATAAAEFTDIEGHAYEASILDLGSRGFVGGYPDGTFRPDNPLQRQQFAKMTVLTLGCRVTVADVSGFPDTPTPSDPVNNPLYPGSYVAVAAESQIIQGYANGLFGFYDNLTRQQAISIAVRAAGAALEDAPVGYVGELDYSDESHGANIMKAEFNGLLAGISNLSTWDPTANATRGEAAEILSKVFQKLGKADLVLKNGVIYTVDEGRTSAEAIAVRGDTIVFVGSSADAEGWIDGDTKVVDVGGKLVLPGLIDSHAHATSGVSDIYEVALYGIGSVEEYQQAIADFVASKSGLTALQGAGWINSVFGEHGPTAAMLDAVCADIPAVLYSEDYHSVWVNTKTLALAGVTAETPTPEGGVIERDAGGNPTGTLRENAVALVADVIPAYTTEQMVEGLSYFQEFAHSLGLTTVYIPSMPSGDTTGLQALHELDASGALTIRFPTAMDLSPEDDVSRVDEIVAAQKAEEGGNYEIVAAKIFMDGVLEGVTAYLEEPYVVRPEYRGELLWDPQHYNEMCAALDKAGIQIHVHSIGDAATRITLDGFAYARGQNGERDSRNMITHLQLVNAADIARFADLGVIAVPQPYWFVVDTYYAQAVDYVGQERADKQYPMKSFFDAGVTVASGSDYPVSWPPDPMLAIEIGVTRTVPEASEIYVDPDYNTALSPAECVTVQQMIESFTINGARAIFKENKIGSLEVGKKADMVVLSQNILAIDPKQIHSTVPLLTYFAGQEVYRSEGYAD